MRISDWSSDVCSSDLPTDVGEDRPPMAGELQGALGETIYSSDIIRSLEQDVFPMIGELSIAQLKPPLILAVLREIELCGAIERSEEHTSELQSLMRSSYAVFCLKKKNKSANAYTNHNTNNT